MVKVKENYFKTVCMRAGILLNVNALIFLKFKLQLEFRNTVEPLFMNASHHEQIGSQTPHHKQIGSRTPLIMNRSVHERLSS
jgi:hypothetical protein